MLIVTAQIELIELALIVKYRMAQLRRYDAAIGRGIAVQDIVADLLANRAAVLERRVHGLVRAAKYLGRAEGRARPALTGDIYENRRLVPVLCFHATQDDISTLPHPGGNHIGEGRAHPFRNRHSIDPELLVRMVLTDVGLAQSAVRHARNCL